MQDAKSRHFVRPCLHPARGLAPPARPLRATGASPRQLLAHGGWKCVQGMVNFSSRPPCPAPLHPEGLARPGARRDFERDGRSVEGGHLHRRTQRSLRKRDGNGDGQIAPRTSEDLVRLDIDHHVQVVNRIFPSPIKQANDLRSINEQQVSMVITRSSRSKRATASSREEERQQEQPEQFAFCRTLQRRIGLFHNLDRSTTRSIGLFVVGVVTNQSILTR